MNIALVSAKKTGTSEKLLNHAQKYFKEVEFFNIKNLKLVAGKKSDVLVNGKSLKDFSCAYLRGSYKYAKLLYSTASLLGNHCYMPISPQAFLLAHDKFLTILKLIENSLPIPETYFVYNPEVAKDIGKQLNFPIVIKLPEGSHGKGVVFADSLSSYNSIIDALIKTSNTPLVIEEYIETGATDIRAFIIGKDVYAMKRIASKEELRANIHAGAKGIAYDLDYDTKAIALKASKIFGFEIGAVDILKSGIKTAIIEINVSPGTEGISKALKIDMAEKIIKFLKEKTEEKNEAREKIEVKDAREIVCGLDIKAGIIKLPKIITKISEFLPGDEVKIKAEKGFIKIEKI